jgi:penicillin amidase
MRRAACVLLRSLVVLLAALALLLLAGWLALRASLPQLAGERAVAGLAGAVSIERDATGVSVVRGASRVDVARATGFLHAQERFFQMDLTRRSAAGELAALLGPALVAADRRLRVHRFRARARAVLDSLPPGERGFLEAYAAGVNAGLAALGARPPEYLLLRQAPRPWQPEDSLLVVYAMWVDLQGADARRERDLDRLAAVLPPLLLAFMSSSDPAWQAALDGSTLPAAPLPSAAEYDLRRLDPSLFERAEPAAGNPLRLTFAPDAPPAAVGSNNWALAGTRTASGRALVANDMHLGLRIPNTWYRARFVATAAGVDVTGVTLPGLPAVVAGSNGRVAWGFTNSYGDFQDLVVIEPAPGDPDRYLTPAGPRAFERLTEIIEVAGGEPEELTVVETIWGPMLGADAAGHAVALAWTAHRPQALNLRLFDLERAAGLDEAMSIAASAGIPAQNALIGDATGRIGWVIAGRIPARTGFDGSRPVSWARDGAGWAGWLDGARHPRIADPEGGQAWSANARVVGGELLESIGDGGYAHGSRSRQIRDGLARLASASPRDFLAIHLDDQARYKAQWRPLLLEVLDRGGSRFAVAAELLRGWSGRAAADERGYRLLREFEQVATQRAFEMLTVEARARWPGQRLRVPPGFGDAAWRLVNERPPHLLDPRYRDWDAWLAAAAEVAVERAAEGCASLSDCRWGQANTARIRHPLSLALPALSAWLDMPATPLPGDWSVPRVQTPSFGASERFAVEPGREADGYFHMPGGQSGHFLSPFYRAGHEAWVRGEPTSFLPGPAEHVLVLVPGGSG